MRITNVSVRPVNGEGKLRAYCSVEFDKMLNVELRVVEGVHGLFVSMPSQKDKNGKYWDLVYPVNAEMRQMIQTAVLGAYSAMAQASASAPEEVAPEEGALLPQEEMSGEDPFGAPAGAEGFPSAAEEAFVAACGAALETVAEPA